MSETTDMMPAEKRSIENVRQHFPMSEPILNEAEASRSSLVRQALAQMGNVQNVMQSAKLANAYKTVGDIALQQLEDGSFSGIIRDENGQFRQHVKFEQASSRLATAASFSYSVLNAAVGQANMMEIAERLANIETQLEEVKHRDYIARKATVASVCKEFEKVSSIVDDDHKRQTVIALCVTLGEALETIKGYILEEISAMPNVAVPKWHENFGFRSSETKPEKAKKRFEYISQLLPVWCQGMSQMVLSDAYFNGQTMPSSRKFIADLKEIVRESGLLSKVQLVPMIGKVDPVKMMSEFDVRIEETEREFVKMRTQLAQTPHLEILAKDIQEVL